jgi:hypothetical protein
MSLATGVADDQLRPALGRLVRSTGDTEKAQQLLAQALDISAATGKPLETVAAALSKGFDGNTAALGKLGVGLSAAELKTMSFEQVQSKLSDLFGGAAARNADTYSGRIARMQVAFDEAKETIGFALLPILEKVMRFINNNALPAINAFSKAFSLDGNGLGGVITSVGNIMVSTFTPIVNGLVKAFGYVKNAIGDNLETFKVFGSYIATYLAPVIGTVLGGALQVAGKIAGGVIDVIAGVVKILNGLISGAVSGINALISAYNSIPFLPNVGKIAVPSVSVPSVSKPSMPSVPGIPSIPTPSAGTGATGGSGGGAGGGGGGLAKAMSVAAGAAAASTALPGGAFTDSQNAARLTAAAGTTINLNVSGAVDKEGTARTIIEALNSSFYRGTGGAGALVGI